VAVHGGGTVRETKYTILASVWEVILDSKGTLTGWKHPKPVPYGPKNNENSPNVFYNEYVHIRDVAKKNWPEYRKSCATHENGPKRTFSRKRTSKPIWPGDIPLVLLWIKLWSIRGGGTVRVMKCIILASVWESNSRFQRHLNGSKKTRNMYPTVQKSMKTSPNVFYKESMHIRDVAKNWPECWKSCAITHENGPKRTFTWKRTCKPFWPRDIPLVLLCIKLWSVLGGGTIRVSKYIILASVWQVILGCKDT
jgi:hypothetical protein